MMKNCYHQKTVCPNHGGGFDCHSFCEICEGEQEFCYPCDQKEKFLEAVKIVSDYLTDVNAHTLVHLLEWQVNGCEDERKDEVLSATYEVAKNFLYAGDLEVLGRK